MKPDSEVILDAPNSGPNGDRTDPEYQRGEVTFLRTQYAKYVIADSYEAVTSAPIKISSVLNESQSSLGQLDSGCYNYRLRYSYAPS